MADSHVMMRKYNEFVGDESLERMGNDVPKDMLQVERHKTGVFFGVKFGKEHDGRDGFRYVGKPLNRDGHVLVVGGAGSGKSSCIAIPTLETWGGMIFAIDIKGELTENWLNVKKPNKRIKTFGFDKHQGILSRYNPFYLLDKDDDDLVQNAREIAQAIIPMPPNVLEPFWTQAAQHVLTGALLYVFGLSSVDEDTGEVLGGTFNQAMTMIQTTPLWKLIEDISNSCNVPAMMHINQFLTNYDFKNGRYTANYEAKESKVLAGISAELSNRVMVFATDMRIKAAFASADDMVKWEDLETHNIFMRIPEDKLGQWDGAITLMLTQLIRTLERRPDVHSAEGKKRNLPPVLLLLDEFPRLGKVDVIQNAVSTLRSKGVTICLMMQSLAQLDKMYGKESRQIIVDNCQYKAILNVTDPENQKIFSDMIGSINVSKKSVGDGVSENIGKNIGESSVVGELGSYSTGETKGAAANRSLNISGSREPIIYPHELAILATLKDERLGDLALMTPEGFCRIHKSPHYSPIVGGNEQNKDTSPVMGKCP